MKRAKIMLTAIVVLAVVGSALAFKAKTLTVGGHYFVCANVGPHGIHLCTTLGVTTQYTNEVVGNPILFNFGTVSIDDLEGSACSDEAPCSAGVDFQSYTINE